MAELTIDQALQKAIEAHKAGQFRDADRLYTAILKAQPKHPDANHNMGILAVGVGKLDSALPFFQTALEASPQVAQFWLSYIDTFIKLDRLYDAKALFDQAKLQGANGNGFDKLEKKIARLETDEKAGGTSEKSDEPPQDQLKSLINLYMIGQYQEAHNKALQLLKQFPKSVNLYNIIGAACQKLGRLEEGINAYKKALSIAPKFPDAYNNMGNALKDQGKLEEAIEAFKKSLSIKPNNANAYNNMGNALKDQGKLEEAINAFNRALSIKPDTAETYNNLGIALKKQGKLEEAIKAYKKALYINPEYNDVLKNMGLALTGIIFSNPDRNLQNIIISLLEQKSYVRPSNIAKAAISLLEFEPNLKKHLQKTDSKVIQNPVGIITDLSKLYLLQRLMEICPLPDLRIEKLLKGVRRAILFNVLDMGNIPSYFIEFQSSLALQCFTNEYIYSQTVEEEEILRTLEAIVQQDLEKDKQPDTQVLLSLASYKALNQYDWCKMLVVTDHIKEVFSRQVEEQNEEKELKSDLPILGGISDTISSEVRLQYERSPYPRWIKLGLPFKPMLISKLVDDIGLKLFDNEINKVEKPDILIAGCGTGQHSITTAATFKYSNLLAIDLSLSSLAYAKRKTKELKLDNIEYLQADILDLGKLSRQFDIIESVGVLHHMDNPMEGWKVLTECLKTGGLMRVGLYSEIARQHISKIRKTISLTCVPISDVELRSFRDKFIDAEKDQHKLIIDSPDFYSMSSLKDLLFHVQEHGFTISQLKKHLNELGLKFCGFEASKIVSHFKKTYTYQHDLYDLDKWNAYEKVNPNAFSEMYQFWCQKIE